MATHFAAPERASESDLAASICLVASSPVVDAMLRTHASSILVLNKQRQILAVNHAWLHAIGVEDPAAVLGLRPGESIHCVHADDHPGGCGTGLFCRTCGAAIAIVASQQTESPVDEECALSATIAGTQTELSLRVRACSMTVEGEPFTLVLLQDITADKRRAMLERAFLHDVNNMVTALAFTADLMDGDDREDVIRDVRTFATRIAREVQIQRALAHDGAPAYSVRWESARLGDVIGAAERMASQHPFGRGKRIEAEPIAGDVLLTTDTALLDRVLVNMLLNALEATDPGGIVRIRTTQENASVRVGVWNATAIPEPVQQRVFQRYFTTRSGTGRGQGTYAIKLFVERYLCGKVTMTSCDQEGTEFAVTLPVRPM